MSAARLTLVLGLVFAATAWADDVTVDHLSPFGWRGIGPTATGGRITDLAIDPSHPSTLYVASASGGLYKSTNKGTTFECIFGNQGTTSIGDIAIDPSVPKTIWLGTGEANNQRSSYWGDGIYRSDDGGESWRHLGLDDTHHIVRILGHPENSDDGFVAALGHLYSRNAERGLYRTDDGGKSWTRVLDLGDEVGVVDVVIDPHQPDRIFAASYERLRRAWHFDGAGPGSAIHRSTDGGLTWEQLGGGLPDGEIGRIGLAASMTTPGRIFATVSNQNLARPAREDVTSSESRSAPGARSEGHDGSTATTSDEDGGPIETPFGLSLMVEDGELVIASLERRSPVRGGGARAGDTLAAIGGRPTPDLPSAQRELERLRPGDRTRLRFMRGDREIVVAATVPTGAGREIGGEIYRTDDGGDTWVKVNERPVGGSPAYYYGQIRVDPQDDQRLYVLGVPFYASEDGGVTWDGSRGRSVHVDHHALWIDPSNPEHLVLGNDGGLHYSWDYGKTWDHVYHLPLAQFYAVGVDHQWPYHIYGGTQDNGSWGGPSRSRSPSGIGRFEWYRCGGGDGFYVQIDPNDSNVIISESQFGWLRRIDRKTGRSTGIRPPQSDPNGPADRYNWNSPVVMSTHDSRVLYFGGNRLFKSYNRGDNWEVISPDLTTANPTKLAGNVPHCTITTISESPLSRDRLLVGTDDGRVHWTEDGGETWIDRSGGFPVRPREWWCSRVELSAHDAKTAYVTFTGYREDDFRPFIFVTRDRGKTWQSIGANLPEGPINVVREDPVQKSLLYVGTEFGVFASFNGGESWLPLDQDLDRLAVHDLVIHPREHDVVAATHARGFYVLDDASPLRELAAAVEKGEPTLFPVRHAVTWLRKRGPGLSGDRRVYAPNPPTGAALTYYLPEAVEELSLKVYDADGKRVATLETEGEAVGVQRVWWNLRADRRGSVKPGHYRAVLTVGETEHEAWFDVYPDPLEH
ncbi:MAG: PDZ domain-containing protein [Planctomycetota bacterium]